MRNILFPILLFLQMTCFGQCRINPIYIDSFYKAFTTYEVNSIGKNYGNSDVISSEEYMALNESCIDSSTQNSIFYDIVHNAQGDKDNIVKRLVDNNLDIKTAIILSNYMLCKHKSKYLKWEEGKRKWDLNEQLNNKGEEKIFVVVEKQPEFPGGIEKMKSFIQNNIKYPYPALFSKTEGKVFVQFVIDYNGIIKNANIVKSIGYGCDEEALRIVNSMPKWKPGMQDGVNVSVRYSVPVVFKLP